MGPHNDHTDKAKRATMVDLTEKHIYNPISQDYYSKLYGHHQETSFIIGWTQALQLFQT